MMKETMGRKTKKSGDLILPKLTINNMKYSSKVSLETVRHPICTALDVQVQHSIETIHILLLSQTGLFSAQYTTHSRHELIFFDFLSTNRPFSAIISSFSIKYLFDHAEDRHFEVVKFFNETIFLAFLPAEMAIFAIVMGGIVIHERSMGAQMSKVGLNNKY